jgi:hypothetical protein
MLLAPKETELDGFFVTLALQQQANKNLKNRWLYLDALMKALRHRKDYDLEYAGLIDAFYAMSGRDFGWNGVSHPISVINTTAAQKAVKQCYDWYLKERPAHVYKIAPDSVSRN